VGVPVFGDNVNEANETFKLVLSAPTNATITPVPPARPEGIATITDNDSVPVVTVGDKAVAEGNSGTTSLNFTVNLSKVSEQPVKVNYTTANGSATEPSDYALTSGTLTFAPGTTSMPVSVPINGDTSPEGTETFSLVASIPSDGNATCTGGDCSGTGTITNDDGGGPTVSINDPVGVVEGTNVVFTVTVSPTTQAIDVTYSTADGTAKAPGDYTAQTAQVLNFPINSGASQTKTITVATINDALDEIDTETFSVNITNATNSTVIDSDGIGSIQDNDAIPTLTIDDKSGAEASGSLGFTIALSAISGRDVTVNVSTADGSAVAGSDYTVGASSVVIPAGTLSVPYGVALVDDSQNEGTENFIVNLTAPTAATCTGGAADCSGTGTITDDDAQPTLSVGSATVTEGTGGTANLEFPLTLSAASGRAVTVTYSTANGSGGSGATSPADFTGATGATAIIPAGSTTGKIVVPIVTDSTDETDETFTVTMTAADFATLGTATATGTINDDDGPGLSIGDVTVAEGSAGTSTASFVATLSAVSPQDVTFIVNTADGTATAGSDYVGISGGTGTITAGQLTTTVPVTVTGDVVDESDETFQVVLSGVTDASLTDSSGVGTITDDDGPTISIGDRTVTEGSSGTTAAAFTVTLSAVSVQAVTMRVDTSNGTASAGSDFTGITNGTLTIPPASTTGTITVQVTGDVLDEADLESYSVVISNPTGATILDGTGAGGITDDDATPTLSIGDIVVTEGSSGTTPATFTVSLSAPSGRPVSVLAATSPGSATPGSDYATTNGTVGLAPGETSKTFVVSVVGDIADEPDEAFSVLLSGPTSATIADSSAVATILDDDPTPVAPPLRSGYWLVGRRGDVFAFGDAVHFGNAALSSNDAIDIEGTPDGNGYWILDTAGRVYPFGSAPFFGDMTLQAGEQATSMSALPGGGGYWVFTNRGRAGAFGAARHFSDMSGRPLNGPVIGSVATPSGQGYYMVATDGGIFAFGDALFHGSMGGQPLNKPVVGLVPDPDGLGYWLDASDGGVFAFEAGFRGSMGGQPLNKPVIGMVSFGNGYLMVASDGGVFNFSDKPFAGSLGNNPPAIPIVNIAAQPR
jgi:chitinase